ncbi:TIGR02186 family protein [Plastorhodobacter daqingensis]|uniref:TIGR02186 family protein n=1 Tax=Plastorhodobacter daqingensis TaxID=1387281 RepID=A0ABW2UIK7_9RHOB
MRWLPVLLLLLLAAPAQAQEREEEVIAALSQSNVAINATFIGSEILVFGAVRREAPAPDGILGVIVTIEGPSGPLTVHRKERMLGIWVNNDAVFVDRAPSFYAVASSAPLPDVLTNTEDLRHGISIPRAIRAIGAQVSDAPLFTEALIRIRSERGLYQHLENAVVLDRDTLFRARISLPSNLTEGTYLTRIFLTRDGRVIDSHETAIHVQKVGLERWIFVLAHEQPFLYGLLSLIVAVAAGWGASALFRYARG